MFFFRRLESQDDLIHKIPSNRIGDACKPVKIVGYLSQYQVADLSPQNMFGNKLSAIDGTEKSSDLKKTVVSPGFAGLMFRGQIMPTLS